MLEQRASEALTSHRAPPELCDGGWAVARFPRCSWSPPWWRYCLDLLSEEDLNAVLDLAETLGGVTFISLGVV